MEGLCGKDCVLIRHMLQAKPIGDIEAYRDASTNERGKAKGAAAGERVDGVPAKSDFGDNGQLFFQEFEDVVILHIR